MNPNTNDDMKRRACGCCSHPGLSVPRQIANRQGLKEVAYRIGTFTGFRNSLLDSLAGGSLPMLSKLNPYEEDDFTIALFSSWAAVADVLTFYQERIANESWLQTATERRSLLELAQLIGYRPAAGAAASTDLAFTLESAPGAPEDALRKTVIEERTRAQSVPGPGEKPQIFETIETVDARVEWNCMRPRLTAPQTITEEKDTLWLEDGPTLLKAGDTVLCVTEDGKALLRRVAAIVEIGDALLRVSLTEEEQGSTSYPANPGGSGSGMTIVINNLLFALSAQSGTPPGFAGSVMTGTLQARDLYATAQMLGVDLEETYRIINAAQAAAESSGASACAFRKRASLFGYNAPSRTFDADGKPVEIDWEIAGESSDTLYLDGSYDGITAGSQIVIRMPGKKALVRTITDVLQCSRTAYGLSAKSTRLTLSDPWWDIDDLTGDALKDAFGYIRGISVEFASESLPLAAEPLSEYIDGTSVLCDRAYPELEAGHRVIVQGEIWDIEEYAATGRTGSEVKTLSGVRLVQGRTELQFAAELSNAYVRDGLKIFGNVARATHGETVRELLGSGDAAIPFPKYFLRQHPLTWVRSSGTAGSASTLNMYVNNSEWKEVESLALTGPSDRVYVTSTDDDGVTTITFGDGKTGARLPSGQNNIDAVYRKGIGLVGNVGSGSITMLLDRPLGVKEVSNPIAASGGVDAESSDDIRRNAALPIMTLGRIVSLKDYEDFARAYTGIAKARVEVQWDGSERVVVLSVLGPNAAEIRAGESTHDHLVDALHLYGDPFVRLRVVTGRSTLFRVAGGIRLVPGYKEEVVLAEAVEALKAAYAFEARTFGESVTLSELYAVLHSVEGLEMADIDALYPVDPSESISQTAELLQRIPAGRAQRLPDHSWQGAELLIIDPYAIDLEVLT